jgi:hypothetical protein
MTVKGGAFGCVGSKDPTIEGLRDCMVPPQGDDTLPPLPISSDFFSTFIDVSDSDPRSLMKV